MMNDLFYQVSVGAGNVVRGNEILPVEVASTDSDRKNFTIFVFGHPIHPSERKNPIFSCRNILANIKCFYVGKDRGGLRASHLDNAVSGLSSCVPDSKDKNFVVIEDVSYNFDIKDVADEDLTDINLLLDNLYAVIEKTVRDNYGDTDVAIYWSLSEEEMSLIKKHKDWGTSCELLDDDTHRALIMYI